MGLQVFTEKELFQRVQNDIENESIGYYLTGYTDSDEMPDEKSRELFDIASGAIRDFEDYINQKAD